MSREHVWPNWIRDLVPSDMRDADHSYVFSDGEQGEFRRVEKQPIFNLTVRGVCEPCNNEWMNRTEEAARPYLTGMLYGTGRELHWEGQAKLAKWGFLKALVAQQSFRDDASPLYPRSRADCRALYAFRDELKLPDFLTVYTAKVAHSAGHASPGFFRMNGIARIEREDGDELDGYVLTFSVLDFAVMILRMDGEDRAEFLKLGYGPRLTKAIGQIWPTRETFTWPPGPALTGAGLAAIGGDDGRALSRRHA